MYIEGDADESVRLHVEQCPTCQARARALAAQQEKLRTLLHRSTCPPAPALRDYAWDLLPDDEAQAIARHLSFCAHCTADYFRDYYSYFDGDTSAEELFTVAARGGSLIRFYEAERVEARWAGSTGVRDGTGQAGQVTMYQSGENVLLMVQILADDTRVGRFVMEGTVSGIEADGLQLNLWQDERPVQTVVFDPAGDFRLGGLLAGNYELILNGPTFKLRIPQVSVGRAAPTADEREHTTPTTLKRFDTGVVTEIREWRTLMSRRCSPSKAAPGRQNG